jgi:hypothetical protein
MTVHSLILSDSLSFVSKFVMSPSGNLKRPSYEIDSLENQPSKRERETRPESSHDYLDQQVLKAMKNRNYNPLLLLCVIVRFSEGKLDPKYKDAEHAMEILETDSQLEGQLKAAWNKKSFKEIRNLSKFQDFSLLPPNV